MKVTNKVPEQRVAEIDELLTRLQKVRPLKPFDDALIEFCADFGSELAASPKARTHPELMALAFFMRRAEVVRMKRDFESESKPGLIRVPRGVVFHVPPANVDTLFMYSWAMSLLCGNVNVIRLSSRSSETVELLCARLNELLPKHPAVRERVLMVQYGHDDALTSAFSNLCALRVIWGGDATIDAIRKSPLPPSSRDLTFANRWSFSAYRAERILKASDSELHGISQHIVNDLFWFSQRACSSPRLAVWVGNERESELASERLWSEVGRAAREKFSLSAGEVLQKELAVHEAVLDARVVSRRRFGAELSVLKLRSLEGLKRTELVHGALFEAVVPKLNAIAPFVERADQTLTHYGFEESELLALVHELNGAGLDRLVPVGQALSMGRRWDGYDLLNELTKVVQVLR